MSDREINLKGYIPFFMREYGEIKELLQAGFDSLDGLHHGTGRNAGLILRRRLLGRLLGIKHRRLLVLILFHIR